MQDVSKYIRDTHLDEYLECPTGHRYRVSDQSLKSSYANDLSSYELALVAQATCETLEALPEVELIGHYHDGNVVMVPLDERSRLLELIGERVKQIGDRLGLRYPQRIECKRSYGEQ